MKTVIGIPVCHYDRDNINIKAIWSDFIRTIEDLNGIPLIIPSIKNVDYYLKQIDGLLLTGGHDIYPPNFRLEVHENSGPFDLERDLIELEALKYALLNKIPTLGICRGAQLIAAYFDSEIIQDLQAPYYKHNQWTVPEKFISVHQVAIEKNSILNEMSSEHTWLVNSGHHQGIKKLGLGLRRAATSPDGLIEAFQHEKHPFLLGIQWHPEVLVNKANYHLEIFKQFIESSRQWKTS